MIVVYVIFKYTHSGTCGHDVPIVLDFAGSRSSLNIFAGNGFKKRFAMYLG